jgi:hypothetical protein
MKELGTGSVNLKAVEIAFKYRGVSLDWGKVGER